MKSRSFLALSAGVRAAVALVTREPGLRTPARDAARGWGVAALLALATGLYAAGLCGAPAASAAPIEYTIDFTDTYSNNAPTGSFFYDSTTETFSDFLVTIPGVTFDLTGAANNPTYSATLLPVPCLNGAVGAAASFALLDGACANATDTTTFWQGFQFSTGGFFFFEAGYDNDPTFARISLTSTDSVVGQSAYSGLGTFAISPVPEPSTVSLLGGSFGLVLLLGTPVRRRLREAWGWLADGMLLSRPYTRLCATKSCKFTVATS